MATVSIDHWLRCACIAIPCIAASLSAQGITKFDFDRKEVLPRDFEDAQQILAADFDGDGDEDLFIASVGLAKMLLNVGGHYVENSEFPVIRDFHNAVAIGDVNRDGRLDLVVGSGTGQQSGGSQGISRLFLNQGNSVTGAPRFVENTLSAMPIVQDMTTGLAFTDVDSDGDLDILQLSGSVFGSGAMRLFENNGVGFFRDVSATKMPNTIIDAKDFVLADFDGDRLDDLIVISANGSTAYLINDGAGGFRLATTALPTLPTELAVIEVTDVEGDGDFDIIVAGGFSERNLTWTWLSWRSRILINDGKGRFSLAPASRLPASPDVVSRMALTDFDGDGDEDVILVGWSSTIAANHPDSRSLHLWRSDGMGGFSDITASGALPSGNDVVGSLGDVDVNGDGRRDLIIGTAGDEHVLINRGNGTYLDATRARLPVRTQYGGPMALVDIDGDGDLDLITARGCAVVACWAKSIGVPLELWSNDSSGRFLSNNASSFLLTDRPSAIEAGDLDGDGDQDLIIGSSHGQAVLVDNLGAGRLALTTGRLPLRQAETLAPYFPHN